MTTTRIALTNLGKYNEGKLVYHWLTLPATEEEIEEAKRLIGINEQYEEWFIGDFETNIEGLKFGEYDDLEALNELLERLEGYIETSSENRYSVFINGILEARFSSKTKAQRWLDFMLGKRFNK